MARQSELLEIKQVFAKTKDGGKLLRRLLVCDNHLSYDLIFDAQGLAQTRLTCRSTNGVHYEIASKVRGQACVNHYQMKDFVGRIYENKDAFGTVNFVTALVHAFDGTVQAGLSLSGDMSGFNVLRGQNRWISFLLTQNGVQYAKDIESSWVCPSKQKKIEAEAVIIDGQKTFPVNKQVGRSQHVPPQSGRE